MNLYPCMRLSMGSWDYFSVKMTMQQVADNVRFAADIHDDPTLSMTIQRQLDESRVKRDIVRYLERQPDRFFSAIVVAALGGNPQFYPVTVEATPALALFASDPILNSTFGVLKFDGTQSYYALDGQHRLSAIKVLLDPASSFNAPDGFAQEHLTVMVVVPAGDEVDGDFLVRYRRLFGNLNRYAKPMDLVTTIAMDEDDAFAIITRRLITEFQFFHAAGRQWESHKIKTKKGKSMRSGDPQFTSLETLYALNIELLKTSPRANGGWATSSATTKDFMRLRPDEQLLDEMFEELCRIWAAMIAAIPELQEDPAVCRDHIGGSSGGSKDSFLFWPICQEILISAVRYHLNSCGLDTSDATVTTAALQEALEPFGQVDWSLHSLPWRGLCLVKNELGIWTMRSEDRTNVMSFCRVLLSFMVRTVEATDDDVRIDSDAHNLAARYRTLYVDCDDGRSWRDAWEEIKSQLLLS